ncbi:hypothetical protein BDK92_0879 [Micromonospora pisi]|uniref:Uncharacterized protein n=1 Tax=Micromonospora pisi TaxID=589240 RepID=A0A495JC97_9ACTN|nr:hypothetical protein BDK92_0879 [Micromonospora pisi]
MNQRIGTASPSGAGDMDRGASGRPTESFEVLRTSQKALSIVQYSFMLNPMLPKKG